MSIDIKEMEVILNRMDVLENKLDKKIQAVDSKVDSVSIQVQGLSHWKAKIVGGALTVQLLGACLFWLFKSRGN